MPVSTHLSMALGVLLCCGGCSRTAHEATQSAQPARLRAAAIQCVPRGLQAAGLAEEWQAFSAHIHACVIVTPAGIPALEIITVSALSYYAQVSAGRVRMPAPLLLRPGGEIVGRLPYAYPDDPPLATTLQFQEWQDEIPRRIEVLVHNAARPGEQQTFRMVWDSAAGGYEPGGQR
jgi:hypothetical protein